jgi:hypothetical protein
MRLILALGTSIALLAAAGVPMAAASDPDQLLVADKFGRPDASGWGRADSGQRWQLPKGSAGLRISSARGVMTLPRRGSSRQVTIGTDVRDVTMQYDFSLDRMPGSSGAKVVAIVRKSRVGAYHLGVRIGRGGRVWMSVAKTGRGGRAASIGDPVRAKGWRYSAGQKVSVRVQAIKKDPTQLRMKVWPKVAAQPSAWQLIRNDRRSDIGAQGRVGFRSVLTRNATRKGVKVRFDNLDVNRATDATRAAPTKPKPTPAPKPAPGGGARCTKGDIIGWGRGTSGGAGGSVKVVRTASALMDAIRSKARPLTIKVDVGSSRVWKLGTTSISKGDLTIVGDRDVVFRGTQFVIKASNVILRGINVGTGDADLSRASANVMEPFTINGVSRPVKDVVLQCVVGVWGPDIGGLAILGDATDVTVQDSIFGEGLYLSKHSEGTRSQNGHSYAINLTRMNRGLMLARVTLARNLIVRSEGRMPKITGGHKMELINNLIVGWGSRAPEGNAESLHVVGNYLIPTAKSTEMLVWSPKMQNTDPSAHPKSVYLKGNVLKGHGGDELRGGPTKVYRSGPAFTPSHKAMSAAAARDFVLANAGGPNRPAWVRRIVDDVKARRGKWFNGARHPGPNPSW